MIKGIYLAAGSGKRFGSQKMLTLLDGIPLFIHSLKSCVFSELEKIIVVLGFEAEKMEREIRKFFPNKKKIIIVINPEYRKGLISSFNAGLKETGKKVEGVMMILGDMPFVNSKTVNRILDHRVPGKFIIPDINGRLAHPRIIPVEFFDDFLNLGSVDSGKSIISEHKDSVVRVKFNDELIFKDIDTKIQLGKI